MQLITTNNPRVPQDFESCPMNRSLPVGKELTSWDDLPLCFGVETLAFIMGCSIGKARDICKNGGLCCYKEGKRYVIFKQDLLDWLEQRRKNQTQRNPHPAKQGGNDQIQPVQSI